MADIQGTEANDTLNGTPENDVIRGLGGNDVMDGKEGADDMRGGLGDDIYYVDNPGDWSIEQMDEGYDTIYSTVSYLMGAFTDEMFLVGPSAIVGTGNQLDNRITGNDANNFFFDGGGTDIFIGGNGDDFYDIRAVVSGDAITGYTFGPLDQVVEFESGGTDTVRSNATYVLPTWVENLVLTVNFNVDGYGNDLDNVLTGNGGNNRLEGGAGNDVLNGGWGVDFLLGGPGDDLYIIDTPHSFQPDSVFELEGEGNDTMRSSVSMQMGQGVETLELTGSDAIDGYGNNSNDRLIGNVAANYLIGNDGNDFLDGGDGNDNLRGGAGDDDIEGGDGDDQIFTDDGGADQVLGGAGNDGILAGTEFDLLDSYDGGAGLDTLALRGSYGPDLQFGASSMTEIETLLLVSGSNLMFSNTIGPPQNSGPFSYDLIMHDGNVAAGAILTVIAGQPAANAPGLQSDEQLQFDGSAESDGAFRIFAGLGSDALTGGAGNDGFFFETGGFTQADFVDGGAGIDSIALRGTYAGASSALVLGDAAVAGIEVFVLLSGYTTEFGGAVVPDGFDYDLTLANGNVAAAARLDIIATGLAADESVRIDGRAELDGSLRILSGAGDDILFGGSGADILFGGGGADQIDGGGGNDVFLYRAVAESSGEARDVLQLDDGDKIDLSFIDAVAATPTNDAFTWIGGGAFSGAPGELRASQTGGQWLVEADVDGNGLADFALNVVSAGAIVVTDFVL